MTALFGGFVRVPLLVQTLNLERQRLPVELAKVAIDGQLPTRRVRNSGGWVRRTVSPKTT